MPPGLQVVSSSPKATVDRDDLLWSLPALAGGKQHSLQVVYRANRTGPVNATADVRTTDNMQAHAVATVQITEAKLQTTMLVPTQVAVGEKVSVQVTVQNSGNGAATNLHIKPQMDASLEFVDKSVGEIAIEQLGPGQKQTVTMLLTPRKAGQTTLKVVASADGGLTSETAPQKLDVKNPDLKVELYGPLHGYLNQEATWTVCIINPGDVILENLIVRATLPREVTFSKANNDGKYVNGVVEWNIGTAVGKQWTDLKLVGICKQLTTKATLVATAAADPALPRDGQIRTVALVKPLQTDSGVEASIEILGIPALQMEVSDSSDPVEQGKQVTYTIRVKNAGTLAATKVVLSLEFPAQLRPTNANGPTMGKITGQKVVFAEVASLGANSVSVFTVDADTLSAGTAKFVAELQSLSLTNPIRVEESTQIVPKAAVPRKTR